MGTSSLICEHEQHHDVENDSNLIQDVNFVVYGWIGGLEEFMSESWSMEVFCQYLHFGIFAETISLSRHFDEKL